MLLLLICAALLCTSAAAQSHCRELYVSYDLSRNFNETIAHSIHSMTVQGLRLFNPRATEDNCVPTVNHNIKDEVRFATSQEDSMKVWGRGRGNGCAQLRMSGEAARFQVLHY